MNNSFLYRVAGRISRIMKDFQKKEDIRREQLENETWNKLFNGDNYFEHTLSNGAKINLYKESVLSRLIFIGFENDETAFLQGTLVKGDVFIDIGANVGLFSLLAAKIVGNSGKVICFEPHPTTFKRLEENINLNNFTNISARNIGLSDTDEELTFFVSNTGYDAWNSFALREDILQEKIIVPVSTLENELSNVNKAKIKLIKIDVEGWEKFVLQGGKDFLVQYSPILMIEFSEENTFNAGYPVYEIYDIIVDFGYNWYIIDNGELVPTRKQLHYKYTNLIAIKNSSL